MAAIPARVGRQILFVGTVESKESGEPIAQRVMNRPLAEFTEANPSAGCFTPTRLVELHGHEVVMRDRGYHNEALQRIAGSALAERFHATPRRESAGSAA